jgi:hypothetical protein
MLAVPRSITKTVCDANHTSLAPQLILKYQPRSAERFPPFGFGFDGSTIVHQVELATCQTTTFLFISRSPDNESHKTTISKVSKG